MKGEKKKKKTNKKNLLGSVLYATICSTLVVTPEQFHSCNKYLLFLGSILWIPVPSPMDQTISGYVTSEITHM